MGAGKLKTKAVACPYHAWLYWLDGTLAAAPMTEHLKDFDKSQYGLKEIAIGVAAGLIFINLDPNSEPFEYEMGGLGEDIETFPPEAASWVVAERLNYDIKANWQVVVDNFSEAYHIPIVHPQLSKVLEQEMVEFVEQRRWTFNRFKSKQGFPGFELISRVRLTMPGRPGRICAC